MVVAARFLSCWHALTKSFPTASTHLSPALGPEPQAPPIPAPSPRPNSFQISQPSQVTRSGVHKTRAAKLEPREAAPEARLKVSGPRTYVLGHGPWPSDRGSGFGVQARYQYTDLRQARRDACQSGALRLPKKRQ